MLMRPPRARPSDAEQTTSLGIPFSLFLGDSTAVHAAKPRSESAATRAETA